MDRPIAHEQLARAERDPTAPGRPVMAIRPGRVAGPVLDAVAVVVFAAIGRRSHAEHLDLAGLVGTAWPFLVGALAGGVLGRAWRAPVRLPAGCWVLVGAAGIGLGLRGWVEGRLPAVFVVVATTSLAVLLLGWRLVALAVLRTRVRAA